MTEDNSQGKTFTESAFSTPFSLRLTADERTKLNADAGPLPLGEYIRTRLFETPSPRKRTFRRPVQDELLLSQVLAALGRSRISSNLNQLAKAIHSGSLPVTPETEAAVLSACSAVQNMGDELVKALGLSRDPPPALQPEDPT